MRKLGGYEKASPYTEGGERLPIGGYVLKILDVKYEETQWGDVIILSFDVTEGEQTDFFANNYRSQAGEDKKWKGTYRLRVPKEDGTKEDEWTMRRFKTTTTAFEDSNKGYHWDWNEQGLKGKLIGGIFNNKEYNLDGRHGFFTNCHHLTSIDIIHEGKYKIPADTLLKSQNSAGNSNEKFTPLDNAADEDEDLPF